MFNHPKVVNWPWTSDYIIIKDIMTREVLQDQKLHIKTPIRELHNDLIKYSYGGGF